MRAHLHSLPTTTLLWSRFDGFLKQREFGIKQLKFAGF